MPARCNALKLDADAISMLPSVLIVLSIPACGAARVSADYRVGVVLQRIDLLVPEW